MPKTRAPSLPLRRVISNGYRTSRPRLRRQTSRGRTRLLTPRIRSRGASLVPDRRPIHHQLNAPVLRPAGRSIIRSDRLAHAESLRSNDVGRASLAHHEPAHRLGSLIGKFLVVFMTPDVVRV